MTEARVLVALASEGERSVALVHTSRGDLAIAGFTDLSALTSMFPAGTAYAAMDRSDFIEACKSGRLGAVINPGRDDEMELGPDGVEELATT
jgi:SseB protein N-terminal domain